MRSRTLILPVAAALLLPAIALSQNSTVPPTGENAVLTLTGKGVQIYACQLVANAPQWVFQAPDASLFDPSGSKVGVHGAGPSWRYYDGSTLKGEAIAKAASPEPSSVPWLLLKVVDRDESGILSEISFIRRSDTHGGNAPATGCDAQHINTEARVPYMATYTFYSTSSTLPEAGSHNH